MKNKISFYSLLFLALLICATGCIPYKTVPYFKDVAENGDSTKISNNYTDPIIQKNDILKITVSSLDAEVTRLFSFNSEDKNQSNANSSGSNYLVDPEGYIRMPLIGRVQVEGFTTWQVRDAVTKLLEPFLKETVVEIRIFSFRIAVTGDVAKPGLYSIPNERLTLTEALTLAGDLNISAKRNNILLVREENGQRKYIRFDLGNKETFSSPYYYLRSNDLVYVQPGPISTRDINFRNLTYLTAAFSLIALIISISK
jgi:polysaccharide export outer membrane protein